jgi:threonine dehydratase
MAEMRDVDITGMTLEAMRERLAELRGDLVHTPVVALQSPVIEAALEGARVALKLECFQHSGTFKARGALSVVRHLDASQRERGITAASAGNHAIAAGWAAAKLGVSAKVVMQSNASPYRVTLARATGADVIMKPPGAETFAEAERLVRDEGRAFVHPFEGLNTSLGAAGVGLEFLAQVPDLEAVVVSVGGGGLISGIAAAVKAIIPSCLVYGVEPEGADSMSQSLAAGAPVTISQVNTVADSLGPPMALPFGHALCSAYVDDVVTISDDLICAGMAVLQQEGKLAVEPAAGAAMAGALGPLRARLAGRCVGVVVCGANIDTQTYLTLLARGQAALPALISG